MGRYVNKGNDGFASVINTNFVDKSMLIEEMNQVMNTENRFLCVTRARRFGKSVAVKMLNAYYDMSCDSKDLFAGLAISHTKDYENHLNKESVIYLDMTDFLTKYGDDDEHLVCKMKHDISEELLSYFDGVYVADNDDLKRYITMNFDGLRDDIVMALNDVPVMVNSLKFSNDMHKVGSKDDVLTLLCHLGYLSYNRDSKTAVIPNYEVRQEFEMAVADTD